MLATPRRFALALACLLAASSTLAAPSGAPTLLLRQPAISADRLAFVYAGDIWLADRDGRNPRQLTTAPAAEFGPFFSPDGRWIAFTASYDNNKDVYVVAVDGGQPRRLTWHPGPDVASGWSADGKRVLFASPRRVLNGRSNQLYEVPLEGGFERRVMEAQAFEGRWSPDGKRLAYRPYGQAYAGVSGWRQHRGGMSPPIWIIDAQGKNLDKVPHENASDTDPIWVGDEVVFVSDRADGAANVFGYSPASKKLRQLTHETTWDVRSVAAFGQTLVYECGGRLKQLDLSRPEQAPVALEIRLDPPSEQVRPRWKEASKGLPDVQLSPTGQRLLITARGDVFTVPVKDGSVRNLTATSGTREQDARWSPDGKRIAFVSEARDDRGHPRHEVVVVDQQGGGRVHHALPEPGYYGLLAWSPTGDRLVLQDNHLNLYSLALQGGKVTRIARGTRRAEFEVSFSGDGRWLAYTTTQANHLGQVSLYDFQTGKSHPATDPLVHAEHPAFSASGDYLFFAGSINAGPTRVGLDMSTQERPLRLGLYALVLRKDGPSPLAPRTGDEDDKAKKEEGDKAEGKDKKKDKEEKAKPPKPVLVDLDGLPQRLVGLPVTERQYVQLEAAADGSLFLLERPQPGASAGAPETRTRDDGELWRFEFEERKAKSLKTGVAAFGLSGNGKKIVLAYERNPPEVGDVGEKPEFKPVKLDGLRVLVDPRAEWRQIFEEAWWMEKEFFYDPGMHGLDWEAVHARYLPLLDHVRTREDLNAVLVEMIGELQVGHNRAGGGDVREEPGTAAGLLGADFELDQGRYRITRIFAGDRWNPFVKAPLAAPGLGVREGMFVLAVNGREVGETNNLYAQLDGTAGKQVVLTVADDARGAKRRDVVVEPVASEAALLRWAWIERNRQAVDAKSGGRVAYVYLPDTADQGFEHFNRMFFAQADRDAVIVDDRRNSGGQAANYVLDVLRRPYLSGWRDRDGLPFNTPGGAIFGPKAMLIDQDAGSGGDFLPWGFKRLGLGPLVGKRTWGGLIGIQANPPLIDGGNLSVPHFRFYTPEGEWRVENEGVAPDIEVELDPVAVNRGEDPQLDAAIAYVLGQLKTYEPVDRKSAPAAPTQLGR